MTKPSDRKGMILYLGAWLPMVPIAIANGVLRETWYGPHLTEVAAHQVSTISALFILGAYIWFVLRRWPPTGRGQALGIGLLWICLTLCFEFLFGHYVAGHAWDRLLADYDLLAGRIWVLIPLALGLAPWLAYRLQTRQGLH